ncbi:peptide methionine sulfoxide reductase [Aquipuribacter nitratireducens]|uniref:Peptide methionine sulfoxide reductase n=1 Tax=Aquipuribacter nitratireducens TaxID=650104 RepID=A0ABW0GQV1_9MICO
MSREDPGATGHEAVLARLARIPEGTSRVRYRGRTWSVTRTVQQGGRVQKLWGEELGGTGVVSANIYVTSGGERFRPCEMPAATVVAFLDGWEPT